MNYDLIIIGGGAAGQMAAISAKRNNPNLRIGIIDRTFALGRKILVCGAGRCNITNINLNNSIANHYYGGDLKFTESIFSQFTYEDILKFFDNLGIELYVERKTDIGKLFPVTDQAKTVTTLLEDELKLLGIDVFLNTEVKKIQHREIFNIETISTNGFTEIKNFASKFLILSAGGKTYPALGSNGSGYTLAKSLGHSIIDPVPSAVPLISKNPVSQDLQGVKLEIEATSIIEDVEIKSRIDDVMFTQYGLSGPAILNISREISIRINRENKSNVYVKLNFFPGKNKTEVRQLLIDRWERRPDQSLEHSLFGIFPNKVPSALLKTKNIDKNFKVKDLDSNTIDIIVDLLSDFIIEISGTRSWNEAEFTAGGISTKEIAIGTLESKLIPNLYFCGEIVNVDGDVGGFNLSWAWSSGFVAGLLKK